MSLQIAARERVGRMVRAHCENAGDAVAVAQDGIIRALRLAELLVVLVIALWAPTTIHIYLLIIFESAICLPSQAMTGLTRCSFLPE